MPIRVKGHLFVHYFSSSIKTLFNKIWVYVDYLEWWLLLLKERWAWFWRFHHVFLFTFQILKRRHNSFQFQLGEIWSNLKVLVSYNWFFYRENIKSQFSSLSLGKKGTLFMKERIGTLFMKESCLYWRVKRKQKNVVSE